MKNLIYKLLILSLFFAGTLRAVAGDTIKYVDRNPHIFFYITATLDKQFTVRCVGEDIEQTFTGTGGYQNIFIFLYSYNDYSKEIIIEGEENCAFTFFLTTVTTSSVDLSRSPSIKRLLSGGWGELESVNLKNCVNLDTLNVNDGILKVLNVSDCRSLEIIQCHRNNLSVLDINITNNPAIQGITCHENHLRLSNLYVLSELIEDPWKKVFERQTLGTWRILIGDTVDFSSEKEFDGNPTNFYVMNGIQAIGYPYGSLTSPDNYTLDNGIFTFHTARSYTIDMRNTKIVQNPTADPARCLAWINVIDFVPVTEITNIPASATVGEVIALSNRIVLPANATYTYTNWEIIDAGTTGATLTGSRLNTTATGFVKVRATIKEGLAFYEDYTQDFVIEIKPLGIDEGKELSGIKVFPNPTTGELRITNYELRGLRLLMFPEGSYCPSHPKCCHSTHLTFRIYRQVIIL